MRQYRIAKTDLVETFTKRKKKAELCRCGFWMDNENGLGGKILLEHSIIEKMRRVFYELGK